jgi:NRAMP (natural resistance-associated macrophage protein)-like metal ion transporter
VENKNQVVEVENNKAGEKFFTLSEFRRELGIPLVLAKKLVVWGEVKAIHAVDGTLKIAASEVLIAKKLVMNPINKTRLFIKALGPGLITGASDDDPSGIGTYSSTGAMFGLSVLWTAAWLLPIMTAVQEVCARIGVVTNKGLSGVIKKHYSKKILFGIVALLIIANVVNIGADLGAIASCIQMFYNINFYLLVSLVALAIILLEVFVQYHIYVKFLKFLTISVLAYVVTGFIAHPPALDIIKYTFIPEITFSKEYLFALIAIFGTTVTPYCFFWQTSEEVEENKLLKRRICKGKVLCGRISHMRTDVFTGMFLANIVFYFIILTTAQVLHNNGITNIESAADAAKALAPLAGKNASVLFALGIIGTGLLAIPILAGSGAYAITEFFNWKEGLELKFLQAKAFYAVIILSIVCGALLNFFKINPITALYYSAFLNGIIAVPLLFVIMRIGDDKSIMGVETNPAWVRFFGWLAVVSMFIAAITMLVVTIFK